MATLKTLAKKYVMMVKDFHTYLIENKSNLLNELHWDIQIVKQLKIGYDQIRRCLVFPIYNENWNLVNIYWHKGEKLDPGFITGGPAKLLYPLPLIKDYKDEELLIYTEGPKDAITALSNGKHNVATHTGGAGSIPNDLSVLIKFEHIATCFDNDTTGYKSATKLANQLKQDAPKMKITRIKWESNAANGYDITDFIMDGHTHQDFQKLVDESEIIQSSQNSQNSRVYMPFNPNLDSASLTPHLIKFMKAVSLTTDAPDEFLLIAHIAHWAGVVGNKIHLLSPNGKLRPNIWTTCFAGSSVARKSTALSIAGSPYQTVQTDLDNQFNQDNRDYTLLKEEWDLLEVEIKEETPEPQTPKKKILKLASDFSDAGFYVMMKDNPVSGVIVASEFADFHRKLHRKWTGQGDALLSAYDGDRMTRFTRQNGEETINEPSFSILGATTFANFTKVFTSTETENGFLSRIFPVVVSTPTKARKLYLDRDFGDHNFHYGVECKITNWLKFDGDISTVIESKMKKQFNVWETDFVAQSRLKYGTKLIPSIERMVPGCLKIAMLLQSIEEEDPTGLTELVLKPDVLKCAEMLFENVFLPSMNYLFENKVVLDEAELNEEKITKIIRDNGNKADRSIIRKKSKIDSKYLDSVLRSMEYRGLIEVHTEHSEREQGGGNPKTIYSLID